VAQVVDQWLRGFQIAPEVRWLDEAGQVVRAQEPGRRSQETPAPWSPDFPSPNKGETEQAPNVDGAGRHIDARVFLFGISRGNLEAAQVETGLSVEVANELRRADMVLTTKTHYRRGTQLVRIAEASGTPVYVLRKNTTPQLQEFLRAIARERGMWDGHPGRADREEAPTVSLDGAMREAEEAAQRVLTGEVSVQLTPQRAYVRRLQHLLAQRFNLGSTSRGREPERAVTFYKP